MCCKVKENFDVSQYGGDSRWLTIQLFLVTLVLLFQGFFPPLDDNTPQLLPVSAY